MGQKKNNILIKKTKMKKTRREKDNNNEHRNEYKQRQRDIKRREREKKLSENRLFFLQRCLYPLCLNKIPLAHKRIFGTTFSQSA